MHRKNNDILEDNLKVLDENGEYLGTFSRKDALKMASEQSVDLIQISESNPPLCKLMEFGRFLYDEKKKQKEQKVKVPEMKEVQIRLNTDVHDLQIKAQKVKKFLSSKHKVKITISMYGREANNKEIVLEQFNKFLDFVGPYSIEKPMSESNNSIMIIIKTNGE